MTDATSNTKVFSKYQIFVIILLAFLQFSVVLDFMILSPMGYHLMKVMDISKEDFSYVVSAYALSAFVGGFAVAGFADKFDRKKLLLFFYSGFIIGTLLCGIADSYEFLFFARIITGLFGGVIGSITNAIITDIFAIHVRGRVMGLIQIAFAGSQVLGIPFGLYMMKEVGWHFPFLIIVAVSLVVFAIIMFYLKPIDEHLKLKNDENQFKKLINTITNPYYLTAFGVAALLATGGYMLMPFGSDFGIHNLGIEEDNLPFLYLLTGISTMFVMPLAGRISDSVGRFPVFFVGSALSIIMVLIYCNLGITPFWLVVTLNIILFVGIMSRIAPAQALMTSLPEPKDRGAFMSVYSGIQYLSGFLGSYLAGKIVSGKPGMPVENYDILGYVVSIAIVLTLVLMYMVNLKVKKKAY